MTHQQRGILRAYANADPNTMLRQITEEFKDFKDRHISAQNNLRAEVDELVAKSALGQMTGGTGRALRPEDREHTDAFASWLRAPTDRKATSDLLTAEANVRTLRPQAAGTTLTGGAGGYSVPEPVAGRIQERVLEISPLRRLAANFSVTSTGTRFLVNRNNASSAWVGETDPRGDTNEPTLDLRAPSYGTVFGLVEATEELLLDSAIDIQSWFTNACAQQIAQAEGQAFVAGNGTNKPLGFLAGPTPVTTGDATRASGTLQYIPTDNAAELTLDSLTETYFSLKAAHRQNAAWVMSSATATKVARMKDGEGRSFWHASLSADMPSTLLGRPVYYCEEMPSVEANAFPIAFGNFEAGYIIADSGGLRITIDDNVTKPGYVRFYVRRRVGGVIYDSEAIKLLKVEAT